MGDLMHALPALTDAGRQLPGISFDWVVDEAFAEVPAWHPAVDRVFRSAHRRWKSGAIDAWRHGEFKAFYRDLNANDYDVIIDAQNNVKSALISWLRRGDVHGMDKASVAERPAHLAYKSRHRVDKSLHAIARQRQLFAQALGYAVPDSAPDFGLREDAFRLPDLELPRPYLFLVHNASWTTKLWPEEHWHELIRLAGEAGYQAVLPGGNDEELERAVRIATAHDNAVALPRLTLSELGGIIDNAAGAVCCDTGLAHLAAMVGKPAVTLYGPTSVALIGTTGKNQRHLVATSPPFPCAPCYKHQCDFDSPGASLSACMRAFDPAVVWETLRTAMTVAGNH